MSLLNKHPIFLSFYIKVGLFIVKVLTKPLVMFSKHLIKVQGLDPNGENYQVLYNQLINAFSEMDKSSYDEDLSWMHKSLEKTRQKLNISESDYLKLTNLSNLGDVNKNEK